MNDLCTVKSINANTSIKGKVNVQLLENGKIINEVKKDNLVFDWMNKNKVVEDLIINMSFKDGSNPIYFCGLNTKNQLKYLALTNDDSEVVQGENYLNGNIVGYAGRSETYSGDDTLKGTYNSAESYSYITEEGQEAWHLVYDFPTHSANGTINSIGFCQSLSHIPNEVFNINLGSSYSESNTFNNGIIRGYHLLHYTYEKDGEILCLKPNGSNVDLVWLNLQTMNARVIKSLGDIGLGVSYKYDRYKNLFSKSDNKIYQTYRYYYSSSSNSYYFYVKDVENGTSTAIPTITKLPIIYDGKTINVNINGTSAYFDLLYWKNKLYLLSYMKGYNAYNSESYSAFLSTFDLTTEGVVTFIKTSKLEAYDKPLSSITSTVLGTIKLYDDDNNQILVNLPVGSVDYKYIYNLETSQIDTLEDIIGNKNITLTDSSSVINRENSGKVIFTSATHQYLYYTNSNYSTAYYPRLSTVKDFGKVKMLTRVKLPNPVTKTNIHTMKVQYDLILDKVNPFSDL